MMALSEDEKTQKLGMIVAMITTGKNKGNYNFQILNKMCLMLRALPVRFAAVHMLSESVAQANSLNIITAFLQDRDRVRFRSHAGTSCQSICFLRKTGHYQFCSLTIRYNHRIIPRASLRDVDIRHNNDGHASDDG